MDAFAHHSLVDSNHTAVFIDLQGMLNCLINSADSFILPHIVLGIICPGGDVVLFDPQMHMYVIGKLLIRFVLMQRHSVHGLDPRITLIKVNRALMSSNGIINATLFAMLCSCQSQCRRERLLKGLGVCNHGYFNCLGH